ncbi:MAG: hypothetical protein NVSMB1_01820 [Polyangiales bacterium]
MDVFSGVRHTVVVSDIHLSEATTSDGDWLRYRQRRWFPDEDFRQFIDIMFAKIATGDRLELIFGGDCIEFEAPRTTGVDESFEDLPVTEAEAVLTMNRVANDHPLFMRTIARVAEAGHDVRFVVGNHDAALTFQGVQTALRQAIAAHLGHLSPTLAVAAIDRVAVCAWFFQSSDGVHVEHGHQYDTYCSFRDPLRPLDALGREIHPTVGSLAFRFLVSRMGFFNPYDERSFMLSVPRYLSHWVRHYVFSRRSLAVRWFLGAIHVVSEVLRHRPARKLRAAMHEQAAVTRAAYARAQGMEPDVVTKHAELFAEPADHDPHRVVREFRLDHAALGAVAAAGLITAAFRPRVGLLIAATAVIAGIAQEVIRPRKQLHEGWKHVDSVARKVAQIYGARAVVFGHTHIPHAEFEEGVLYANTGSWAPAPDGPEFPKPSEKGRPLVWLRRPNNDASAPLDGGLYRLHHGEIVADALIRYGTTVRPTKGPLSDVQPLAIPSLKPAT